MHRRHALLPAATLVAALTLAPATTVAASGPVAHWAFDEASGVTILDGSGNDRDGTFNGQVTRIDDGVYGRALRLHSASTSMVAPGDGLTSESITVSIWVRAATTPATGAVLLEKGARGCEGASYGLYVLGNGLEIRLMGASGDVSGFPLTTDLGLWDGDWHHISMTYTWFVGSLRLYVDGNSWGWRGGGLVINETDVTSHDFAMGTTAGGSGCGVPAYVGDLDDVRIYDRELDAQELGALEKPVTTTTTLVPRSGVSAYIFTCLTTTVTPTPQQGTVHLFERLGDGSEVLLGIPSNDWCANPDPPPPQGTWLIPVRFETKGTHKLVAKFVPGNPWLASTSAVVDQVVAGIDTTTYIQTDPVAAGDPVGVTVSVAGRDAPMTGSVSLIDVTGGTENLLGTMGLTSAGQPNGSAAFSLPGRAAGTYALEARYLGSTDLFEPSSATANLVVDAVATQDTVPPTASAPGRRLLAGSLITAGKTTVRLAWTGSDALSGIARYELGQSTDGGAWTSVSTTLTAPTLDRPLTPAHTYRFRVRAIDNAGNAGAWMTGSTFGLTHYGETSTRIRYSGTWSLARSSVYWGGQAKRSSSAGARASITTTGRGAEWVARVGPTYGKALVYVNGVLKATIDLYAPAYQSQRVVWAYNWSSSASRTITIKVLGTAGRPRVDLDAIVVAS